MSAPDFVIFVVPETLSDGSKVFNVQFGGMKFEAITEEDASELAEKISEAIGEHANHTTGVVYE